MTRFSRILLAGTASLALVAGPALAAGPLHGTVGVSASGNATGSAASADIDASANSAAQIPGATTAAGAARAQADTMIDAPREAAPEEDPAAMPEVDSVAQLQALGYSDIEPLEAEGSSEGEGTFTAINLDGERVHVTLDMYTGMVIGEEPAY